MGALQLGRGCGVVSEMKAPRPMLSCAWPLYGVHPQRMRVLCRALYSSLRVLDIGGTCLMDVGEDPALIIIETTTPWAAQVPLWSAYYVLGTLFVTADPVSFLRYRSPCSHFGGTFLFPSIKAFYPNSSRNPFQLERSFLVDSYFGCRKSEKPPFMPHPSNLAASTQSVAQGLAVPVSHCSLLEMQNLGLFPRPTESESAF